MELTKLRGSYRHRLANQLSDLPSTSAATAASAALGGASSSSSSSSVPATSASLSSGDMVEAVLDDLVGSYVTNEKFLSASADTTLENNAALRAGRLS
jgi:hypothetical protein